MGENTSRPRAQVCSVSECAVYSFFLSSLAAVNPKSVEDPIQRKMYTYICVCECIYIYVCTLCNLTVPTLQLDRRRPDTEENIYIYMCV